MEGKQQYYVVKLTGDLLEAQCIKQFKEKEIHFLRSLEKFMEKRGL